MSLYQRGKSWYYDFLYRGERYTGCIGPVSRTVAKEILAKKKAEVVEGRYELPSKKPSPRLDEFVGKDYFPYYRANRRPQSVQRHVTAYRALQSTFGHLRLSEISPLALERYKRQRKEDGLSEVTINRELAFLKNLFTKYRSSCKDIQICLTISRYAGIPPETRMALMGGDRAGTRPQVKHTHCLVS